MAAIIASVAPHETVTSASASTVRLHAVVYLRATACRSEGAPHVVAYWLKPPRSAFAAASRMRGSGSKSGNPWAKLTASSGPWSARLRRVISRITDSVKLWAFSDWRIAAPSMSGISPLQAKVGARAREALWRPLETSLPPAADLAGPARLGEEVEDVGPAQEADHLAPADHGHAAYALADQQPRRFVDPGLLGDGDDPRAHDVARRLAPLGEDVGLGDDADDVTFVGDHGGAGDVLGRQRGGDLVDRRVFAKRDHVPRHHFLDRDHLFQECSHRLEVGVAAARMRPVLRPSVSLPATWAASGSAPVGSRARCRRDHATLNAAAISSSVTVTTSSTRPCSNITSKLRFPIAVVRTPSASVDGDAPSVWMLPDRHDR